MPRKQLMVAVSLVILTTLMPLPLVCQNRAPSSMPVQNVLVVNPVGQPVPTAPQGTTQVAGTVSIGNAPNVNVTNTPNVNISNTPSVNVANTPNVNLAPGASIAVTNPLDGQNQRIPLAMLEAIQPYEDGCQFSLNLNRSGGCSFQNIPSGKRLVVQELDMSVEMDTGLRPLAVSFLATRSHSFTATYMGTSQQARDWFATHQETRLYVGANQTPGCGVLLTGITQVGVGSCQISGFLVDVP